MTATLSKPVEVRNVGRAMRNMCATAKPPRRRTMREFAEQELVLKAGPLAGERFRCSTQPWSGLLIDAMDRWPYRKITITGPAQSGKTTIGTTLPIMFHIFEHKETVIFGAPDMDMIHNKWLIDVRPAIESSRFRDLLPSMGSGSRMGKTELIQFRNGAVLKFMSGGGGDAERSHFSARVVVLTEVDKMEKQGEASQEANKISQFEARTGAHGDRARIYKECTVTHDKGCVWQGFSNGTASRIVTPCPHCKTFVEFTREHLQGWQSAENEIAASLNARFQCPECGKALNDTDRVWSNRNAILVHRGQEFTPDGTIIGEPAQTETLGLRWSGFHNLLKKIGELASGEWQAMRNVNSDDAEKERRQFHWCIPYEPPVVNLSAIEFEAICKRVTNDKRGVVPDWATHLALGVDVGKYLLHWVLLAGGPGFRCHAVDYGVVECPSRELGEERGVMTALRRLREELVIPGWPGPGGQQMVPGQVWVDSGWQGRKESPDFVFDFLQETNTGVAPQRHRWRPIKGFGTNQYAGEHYRAPLKLDEKIRYIGDHYHLAKFLGRDGRFNFVMELSSDHWKMFLHSRLETPQGQDGAMTLFNGTRDEHLSYAKHMCSEYREEEFKDGVGWVVRWHTGASKHNHKLDASCYAIAALHFCGVTLIEKTRTPVIKVAPRPGIGMPDGRPFLITR